MKHLPLAPCEEPFQLTRLCKTCRHSAEVDGTRRCSRVVAESPLVREVLARAAVVASTDSSVLITGETGSGKEVLARLIHSNSRRASGPFVAVNVAALPAELLESELFGHVRGAFTGAVSTTPGLFGEADGGTLFLDEIGEMPLSLQAKLLRVLQEREVRRVGETRHRRIDVRVISATHQDPAALVRAGRFRADLFYRIKVFALAMPPLRERRQDIVPLGRMVAEKLGAQGFDLTQSARAALHRYGWPGNVRELANAIEHAVAFARGGPIDELHLPEELRASSRRIERLGPLAEIEQAHIRRVLDACEGNQVAASKILGIGRSTLWRKLQARALLEGRSERARGGAKERNLR